MPAINEREKFLAASVNIAAIFFPYAGPIVGAIACPRSPYVKFHAFRNLIEQIVSTVVIAVLMIASLTYTIYTTYHTMQDGFDWSKINWWGILIKSAVTYLLLLLWAAINVFLSIRDAIEALQGKVPLKPKWSERKAMKLAGINAQPLPQTGI